MLTIAWPAESNERRSTRGYALTDRFALHWIIIPEVLRRSEDHRTYGSAVVRWAATNPPATLSAMRPKLVRSQTRKVRWPARRPRALKCMFVAQRGSSSDRTSACFVGSSIANIRTTALPIVLGVALAGRCARRTEYTDPSAHTAPCFERRRLMKNSLSTLTLVVFGTPQLAASRDALDRVDS
jgi:hypothetical protein